MRAVVVLGGLWLSLTLTGCEQGSARLPATEDGAKALLGRFFKPDADYLKLTAALRPSSPDYHAVFASARHAKQAEISYASLWEMVKRAPIKPKPGQTELLLWSATTEQLGAGTGDARQFPGGYRRGVQLLKSGLTIYRWKFVRPQKTLGMAYDGLFNVNGRWVLMPKPWRAIR